MVRWIDLDVEAALRIAHVVPADDVAAWPLIAPVVWSSLELRMPVLTAQPELYAEFPVDVTKLP